jgi:hypothetical protein
VFVCGTAHAPLSAPLSLCAKDFAVPGGVVRRDAEFCDRFLARLPGAGGDVLAHRGEHSVELQAVWLRHIWGDAPRIVPILAGALSETGSEHDAAWTALADLFADAMALPGGAVFVASADLAHVGPRFGDDAAMSDEFLAEVEAADRAYLTAVGQGSASEGLDVLSSHGDRYRVCGAASVYGLGCAWVSPGGGPGGRSGGDVRGDGV